MVFGTYFWGNLIQRLKKSKYNNVEYAMCEDGENDYRIFIDRIALRCHRADPVTRLPTGGKLIKKAALDFWFYLPGIETVVDYNSGNIYIGCIVEPVHSEQGGGGLLEVFLGVLLPAGGDKVASKTLGVIYRSSFVSAVVTEPEKSKAEADSKQNDVERYKKKSNLVRFDRTVKKKDGSKDEE